MYRLDLMFAGALVYSIIASAITLTGGFEENKHKGYLIDCLYPLAYFTLRMFYIIFTGGL